MKYDTANGDLLDFFAPPLSLADFSTRITVAVERAEAAPAQTTTCQAAFRYDPTPKIPGHRNAEANLDRNYPQPLRPFAAGQAVPSRGHDPGIRKVTLGIRESGESMIVRERQPSPRDVALPSKSILNLPKKVCQKTKAL